MKKVLKKSVMLMSLLLITMMVRASVIGDADGTTSAGNVDSVAGCEDNTQKMKKLNCTAKDGGPAYGCSTSGTLETCTIAQACP